MGRERDERLWREGDVVEGCGVVSECAVRVSEAATGDGQGPDFQGIRLEVKQSGYLRGFHGWVVPIGGCSGGGGGSGHLPGDGCWMRAAELVPGQ